MTGTPYQPNSPTSKASAAELDRSGNAENQNQAILGHLKDLGTHGATADELTLWMKENGFPHVHNGTVAGRLVTLELMHGVVKTDRTRETRSKRQAVVYCHILMAGQVNVIKTSGLSILKPSLREFHKQLQAGNTVEITPDSDFASMLKAVMG